MVDIENILASLYAHEINVSLAWGGDYGFVRRLGTRPWAKKVPVERYGCALSAISRKSLGGVVQLS